MTSEIKPNYDENRQILADVIPLRTPLSIQVTSSSLCNLKCNYCIHASSNMKNKKIMEWPIFLKLCEQMKEFDDKIKQINFAGWGEPLVNKDLPRMVSHLKESDIAVNIAIITNGALLKEDYVLSLIDAGADYIKISLQGISSDKYKEVCGVKINFDEFVKQVVFLYKNKQKCKVYIKIADIALHDEAEEELFYSTFRDITDRMFVESIRPIFDDLDQTLGLNSEQFLSKYGQLHPPVIVCPQPFFMMNISSSGEVLPCCGYYDPTNFGDITQTTLKKVWSGEKMKSFHKMMLSGARNTQDRYPVCCNCKIPDVTILPGDELQPGALNSLH